LIPGAAVFAEKGCGSSEEPPFASPNPAAAARLAYRFFTKPWRRLRDALRTTVGHNEPKKGSGRSGFAHAPLLNPGLLINAQSHLSKYAHPGFLRKQIQQQPV
jgi:hypothetical protein